MELNLAE